MNGILAVVDGGAAFLVPDERETQVSQQRDNQPQARRAHFVLACPNNQAHPVLLEAAPQ